MCKAEKHIMQETHLYTLYKEYIPHTFRKMVFQMKYRKAMNSVTFLFNSIHFIGKQALLPKQNNQQ